VSTVTTAPVDEGVIEAQELAAYLVLLNEGGETFMSRWAQEIADDLYKRTYGEIELDALGDPTGRYVEIGDEAYRRAQQLLRELAGIAV
jgi:hypothetical protein